MKKIIGLAVLISISFLSQAQTITVRDQTTREPLENVVIQDKNNIQVKTNIKGKADVSSLIKGDSAFVFQFGYILYCKGKCNGVKP